MKLEFERYGLAKYHTLIGVLQLAGGAGTLLGFYFSVWLLRFSTGGLFLLMLAGFIVRLKIKDGVVKSTPAFLYAILSLYILCKSFYVFL